MSAATQAIRRDHRNMWILLNAIEAEFTIFKEGQSADYELLGSALRYCLHYPELYHHPKEDIIYAKLSARDPDLAESLCDLHGEHEALNDLTRRMAVTISRISSEAEVARPPVGNLMDAFIATYRDHMRMEEEHFLPAAESCLTAEDWDEVESEIAELYDPLKEASAASFVDLRRMVVEWGSDNASSTY